MFGSFCKPHHITMNTYHVDMNTKLPAVYHNEGKPNLFRVHINVTLSSLKGQLDKLTVVSTIKTQGGWKMLTIIVRWSTQMSTFYSPRWNSRTMLSSLSITIIIIHSYLRVILYHIWQVNHGYIFWFYKVAPPMLMTLSEGDLLRQQIKRFT